MQLRRRTPPLTAAINTPIPSQILAPPSDEGKSSSDARTAGIIAESQTLVVSATVTQPTTVVLTPTATATVTPSATAAPAPSGLGTGAIAGIAVAVAAVLLIPAAYLIWRSHQIKSEDQRRSSQRSSQEAMIMRESVEPKRDPGPPPPRPRRSPSETPQERPANSLGLFNFDLGSPTPAPTNPPQSPERPKPAPRLSIARTLQLRRSEVSVVNQERRSQQRIADLRNGLRNNPPTKRNSRDKLADEPPAPQPEAPSSPDSKFAPLDSIGTAVSAGRPKFSRNPSTSTTPRHPSPPPRQEMPRSRTPTGPTPGPPGVQDMRQGPVPRAPFSDRSQSRPANPHLSAYSVSDYHDSLLPPPRAKQSSSPSPSPSSSSPQPPPPPRDPAPDRDVGRALSPIRRAVSPINSYQLPTLSLGTDDRFSWGGVNTTTTTTTGGPPSHHPIHHPPPPAGTEAHTSNNNNNNNNHTEAPTPTTDEEGDRRSDVSGLSYNPVYDNRQSDARAISPVESEDDDMGMRTREYL